MKIEIESRLFLLFHGASCFRIITYNHDKVHLSFWRCCQWYWEGRYWYALLTFPDKRAYVECRTQPLLLVYF